jgi:CRP-like cAMP-binding protein
MVMATAELMRKNAVLRQLPDEELTRIRRRAEIVDSGIGDQVYEPGVPITEVYFPLSSVFSLVAMADSRIVVEVATVGLEGMVGLPLFLGATASPHASFCQISGESVRLSANDLRRALSHDGALHRALNRLAQATMVQIAQNVVCNSTHELEQRAARWLLTTHDRVHDDSFPLKQQFLAQMLGARRPTVSQIARRLQDKQLISYARGVMQIVDRAGLERAACPCYAIVRSEFEAMFDGD